jgi:hypothetical protein
VTTFMTLRAVAEGRLGNSASLYVQGALPRPNKENNQSMQHNDCPSKLRKVVLNHSH